MKKISDLYSKKEVEKLSKKLLVASIIVPSILLIAVTIALISISVSTINSKINESLSSAVESVESNVYFSNAEVVEKNFKNCYFAFYDEKGSLLKGKNFVPKTILKNKKNNRVILSGTSYAYVIGDIKNETSEYSYYVIFRDVTQEQKLLRGIVWGAISLFIVAFAILVGVTYFLVNMQTRNYENSINRNNRLIADISHEFNTPLAIIKASIANIMAEPEQKVEDVSEQLVTVSKETGRLNRMVKDMLLLSRSDTDNIIVDKKNCDISMIVKEITEPFEMMCSLENKQMNVDIADGVKSHTDEDKLKQAIVILLDNAMKYTKPGESISLTLKSTPLRYKVIVADSGRGVPDKELENIFERFYRTDYSRNSQTGGSGLGLSIVKAITNALRGRVYAQKNNPRGLIVVLEFPKEKLI